jgi:hypothetical protein
LGSRRFSKSLFENEEELEKVVAHALFASISFDVASPPIIYFANMEI